MVSSSDKICRNCWLSYLRFLSEAQDVQASFEKAANHHYFKMLLLCVHSVVEQFLHDALLSVGISHSCKLSIVFWVFLIFDQLSTLFAAESAPLTRFFLDFTAGSYGSTKFSRIYGCFDVDIFRKSLLTDFSRTKVTILPDFIQM